jgi:WD40 repeat protein
MRAPALVMIAVVASCPVSCSKEPAPTPIPTPSPGPDPGPKPSPTPRIDGTAAASCAETPALAQPTAEHRVRLTARVVNGINRTHSYEMRFVAAAPDGARWAGSASDGAALWEGTERLRHIPCTTGACQPHEVAFAADGKTLMVGPSRFDIETGQGAQLDLEGAFATTGMNEVESVAWAADGTLVLAATQHRPSRCCRDKPDTADPPPSGPRLLLLDGHTGALVRDLGLTWSRALAITAAQVVAGTRDGLTVWDRATLTPTVRVDVQASRLVAHPSGALLASVQRGEVTLWRLPDFCPVGRFAADREFVHALAFHPTAPVLFTTGTDGAIHAYSTDTPGLELGSYAVPGARSDRNQVAGTLALTADGASLVAPIYMEERVLVLAIDVPR